MRGSRRSGEISSAPRISKRVLVPGGGIEPPQAFWALRILSPLRLPISPSRLMVQTYKSKEIIGLPTFVVKDEECVTV